jgi:trigger factor
MQVNLTHHSATRKSLEFVVPTAEVNAEFGKVLAKLAPKVRIPGFRPGKAPKDVLLSRYQREIYGEVIENLVKLHFWSAAAEAGTQPISQPAVEKAELKEGSEGLLRIHFDVAPEVALPDYKGVKLTKKKRIIDAAAIEEHLEGLRQQAAKFTPLEEAAAEGHFVTFDVKVKPQGLKAQSFKDQVVQLAAERPFDKELIGLKTDDAKSFTITIPAEDPNKAMAGKSVTYEVQVKDLRKREVPELSDEFAKDMGDYPDMNALREFVAKDLEQAAERDAQARLQTSLLDTLLDSAPFEVPASMVALQLDDYCNEFAHQISRQGVDPRKVNWSSYRQSRMNEAERAVRSGYLLQAIGNSEDIQVTEEEIDVEIRNLMEEHQVQQPFEPFKADLERRGATTELKGRVRTEKIFEKLLGFATVTEELLDKDAFQALIELERKRETGAPVARFDAGGMEGGDLEDQEGGDPDAVKPVEEVEEVEAEKPKKTTKKATEESEEEEEPKPKKAAKKADEVEEKPKKAPKKTEAEEKPKKSAKK